MLDRVLTDNEIFRTGFKFIPKEEWNTTLFKGSRDPNEMCIYCKNEDTDVVRDEISLAPFKQFYSRVEGREFKVMSCYCCNAIFSTWWDK